MISINPLLHGLVAAEPLLNLIALMAILKAGLSKRFPAMTFYLALRCVTDAGLYFVLNEHHFLSVSLRTQTLTYYLRILGVLCHRCGGNLLCAPGNL